MWAPGAELSRGKGNFGRCKARGSPSPRASFSACWDPMAQVPASAVFQQNLSRLFQANISVLCICHACDHPHPPPRAGRAAHFDPVRLVYINLKNIKESLCRLHQQLI